MSLGCRGIFPDPRIKGPSFFSRTSPSIKPGKILFLVAESEIQTKGKAQWYFIYLAIRGCSKGFKDLRFWIVAGEMFGKNLDFMISQLQISYFSSSGHNLLFSHIVMRLYYYVPWETIIPGCRQGSVNSIQIHLVWWYVRNEMMDKFFNDSFMVKKGYRDATNPEVVAA